MSCKVIYFYHKEVNMILKIVVAVVILIILMTSAESKSFHTVDFQTFRVVMNDHERENQWQNGTGPLVNKEFQNSLNEITNSQVDNDNKAMLLINGMMSFKVRYQLIEKAKKSIIISLLSIHKSGSRFSPEIRDLHTKRLVDSLIKARQRGVKVFVIYDGISSFMRKSQKVIDQLRSEKIEVIKYNPYISQNSDFLGFYPLDILNVLRKIFFFSNLKKQSLILNRWHDKTILVDSRYAIIGGINWGKVYAEGNSYNASDYSFIEFLNSPLSQALKLNEVYPPNHGWGQFNHKGWRDTDILLHGPVVLNIQERLIKDFLAIRMSMKRKLYRFQYVQEPIIENVEREFREQYEGNPVWLPDPEDVSPTGPSYQIRYMAQRPFLYMNREKDKKLIKIARAKKLLINESSPNTYISNYYLNVINNAKKQILWGSFSLGPDDQILNALLDASKRGVKIHIITNSKETSKTLGDKGIFTYRRNKISYESILSSSKGKIRIFEWQAKIIKDGKQLSSGAFHSKGMEVDGVLSIIGSYNISNSSFHNHSESVAVVISPQFSKYTQAMFQNDLKYTKEVKLK